MPRGQYSIAGYRNKLRTTRQPVLLVEGTDDKRVFAVLLESMSGTKDSVVVDTAELIDSPPDGVLGNRDKVEAVCSGISPDQVRNRFVGFVDREFRGFRLEPDYSDEISDHLVSGCLVWSRGHSIENYMLEYVVLQQPLRAFTRNESFPPALETFGTVFGSVIALGCALGLAANDVKLHDKVKKSLGWRLLRIEEDRVALDTSRWRLQFQGVEQETIERLVVRLQHWLAEIGKFDPEVTRWACHGHTGLRLVWEAYARCVFEVNKHSAEADQVLRADEGVRFNLCADALATWTKYGRLDSPSIVLSMLGLDTPFRE